MRASSILYVTTATKHNILMLALSHRLPVFSLIGLLFCLFRYTDDQYDDFEWSRKSSKTTTRNTGPSLDHTYGTSAGYYMYIEATRKSAGEKARLLSPKASVVDGDSCVTFWYHMYGVNIGQLNVYAKVRYDSMFLLVPGPSKADLLPLRGR